MTVNDASGLPPESPGRPSTRAELEEVKISFSSKKRGDGLFHGIVFGQPKIYPFVYELVKIVRGKNLQ